MKKLLLIGAGLIVIVIIVLVIGLSKLGPVIKTAVNTYGPQLTKTELSVGDVGISLLSGKVELKDFLLGSPRGFTSPEAMNVGKIFIDIDPKSITKDTIVIHTIEVIAPSITYEKKRRTDNFKTIINNVNSYTGPSEPKQEAATKETSSEPGKKIRIEDFILKQGTVTLATTLKGGKSIKAQLPDIHLKNIGGKGASPQQVSQEIFKVLYKEITSRAVTDTLNKELKALEESLGVSGEDVKKQAGGILKGLFGK
jgi:uncharacterized protein involved in outer membrane biogenesis